MLASRWFSLAFQSCRDRIQDGDGDKFHQISINASFFSACHSSQLYSSVRSVEQLTLDFQARLEALEEQKNLEESDTGL